MPETITISRRINGPPSSGNGGYACGLVALAHGGPTPEVTLRRPPPLDRPLVVVHEDDRVCVYDGDAVVAECTDGEVAIDPPRAIDVAVAQRAADAYPGFDEHSFPTCFVCGPKRPAADGLRIFAGPVADGVVAAPWTPHASLAAGDRLVAPQFVWAALDCPGAIAVGYPARGETVLGRFCVELRSLPRVGEPHVVVGWPLGEDGRKLYAGTALFDAEGELRALARATWIVPR